MRQQRQCGENAWVVHGRTPPPQRGAHTVLPFIGNWTAILSLPIGLLRSWKKTSHSLRTLSRSVGCNIRPNPPQQWSSRVLVSIRNKHYDGHVKIKIAWIGKTKEPALAALTDEYLKRISRYAQVEGISLRNESDLLAKFGQNARSGSKCSMVLMDSRGKEFTSEQFAIFLADYQDRNPLPLVFAIGGADGFAAETKSAAANLISLGKITMAHELARIVLLEQVYRAFTILKGHPYHSAH